MRFRRIIISWYKIYSNMFKSLNSMLSSPYPILRSKILLYLVTFISLSFILMLGMAQEYIYVIVFILVAYLTKFYSKNMTVILLIGLAVTNVVRLGRKATVNEGLDTMAGDKTATTAAEEKPAAKAAATDKPKKEEKVDTPAAPKASATTPLSSTTADSASNLLNKLSSAMNTEGGDKTDIAALQKKASELVSTQDKLMENMSQLGPLLEKAEGFLNKYEGLKTKIEGMKSMKADLVAQKEGLRNMKEGFTNRGGNISWN